MESFATPYPVIFHDGERDHDKGQIGVHSVLTFKRFQSLLSQKVGFPASQLSATFVCRRTAKTADNRRQKLPINENTNFNIILNQHNPMWEKDCHFLVSIKKSKKERKGTRRRNVDAENGEDEDSGSSRGDVSPPGERQKSCGSADDETTQEDSLATAMVESVTSSPNESGPSMHKMRTVNSMQHSDMVNQRLVNVFPDGRQNGEKILLRRDQSLPGSLAPSILNRSPASSPMDNSMVRRSPPLQPESKKDNLFGQNEHIDCKEVRRNDSNGMLRQQVVVPSTSEGFQERYHDVMKARSAALLQRTGVLNLPSTGGMLIPSFAPKEAVRPLAYPSTGALLLSRVSPGLTSGTTAALQQAQAHYLNIQAQHSEQMQLNSQALSKMRGVVSDFATRDNGGHVPSSVCQYCCSFRERNINPTPFHLCVHDRVTKGFRGPSPAGPIERPSKRVEAAA